MKIATLNIDWAKTYLKKNKLREIGEFLDAYDADILILTEAVPLNLNSYPYLYTTTEIPKNVEFEELNYTEYLNGQSAYRVCIYSRIQSSRKYGVKDKYTSICREFPFGNENVLIYGTIIGTRFNKMPYAQNELHNCITDCLNFSNKSENLCLCGDLNTSLSITEKDFQIKGIKSQELLLEFCTFLKFDLTTGTIKENIDHILLSNNLAKKVKAKASVFIEQGILSDHKGIEVKMEKNFS